MKMKKLKGGHELFITEDEKLLATSSSKNTVYIYDLETRKLQLQVNTVSNVSEKAISPDKKLLAAKNTSGTIALISMETGEELGRSGMEYSEGEAMAFTPDSKYVLDFDWDGRTMLFECSAMQYSILDGPKGRNNKELPRTAYLHYDRYSNQIYKFIADDWGDSKGRIQASSADIENISFEVIREFEDVLPDKLAGISFCKEHNYYVNYRSSELIVTDKKFAEVSRIPFPIELEGKSPDEFWVSPHEKYLFVNCGEQCDPDDFEAFDTAKSLSCLFELDTMKLVQEFDYEFISDFVMFDEDRKFVLATWNGSYLGEI